MINNNKIIRIHCGFLFFDANFLPPPPPPPQQHIHWYSILYVPWNDRKRIFQIGFIPADDCRSAPQNDTVNRARAAAIAIVVNSRTGGRIMEGVGGYLYPTWKRVLKDVRWTRIRSLSFRRRAYNFRVSRVSRTAKLSLGKIRSAVSHAILGSLFLFLSLVYIYTFCLCCWQQQKKEFLFSMYTFFFFFDFMKFRCRAFVN